MDVVLVCCGYFEMMGRLMVQVGLLCCRVVVVGGMLLVCRKVCRHCWFFSGVGALSGELIMGSYAF